MNLLCPPVLKQISNPKWWCGAYQYCLKLLLCCCIQHHYSFCFQDKFISDHLFCFFVLVECDIRFLYASSFSLSTVSATWNHKDDYNLCFNLLNWITCGGQYDSQHGFTEFYIVSGGGSLLKSRPVRTCYQITKLTLWGKKFVSNNLCIAEQAFQQKQYMWMSGANEGTWQCFSKQLCRVVNA